MNIHEKLLKIQLELKAPKSQFNQFGSFRYRTCEDILEALKPLFDKYKTTLIISNDVEVIGERYYIKAIATLYDNESEQSVGAVALAREEETVNNKGMTNASQITGSTISYASKYALNGLFCIDDSAGNQIDADTFDKSKEKVQNNKNNKNTQKTYKLSEAQVKRLLVIGSMAGYTAEKVLNRCKEKYGVSSLDELNKNDYEEICDKLENKIQKAEK